MSRHSQSHASHFSFGTSTQFAGRRADALSINLSISVCCNNINTILILVLNLIRVIDKTKYPLIVLKDLKGLMVDLQSLVDENKDIIEVYDDPLNVMSVIQINEPHFYFLVSDLIEFKDEFTNYSCHVSPEDEFSLNMDILYFADKDRVIKDFSSWIKIVREYEGILFTDEEKLINQYEDEFYSEFEIIDEDADDKAFNSKQQEIIYKWLTAFEKDVLSNTDKDISQPLISATQELKENIQNLTKKQFIKQFSKLMAKVKKVGLKLLYDVFDVAKKEVLKKALYGGLNELGSLGDHITNTLS